MKSQGGLGGSEIMWLTHYKSKNDKKFMLI